jgi:shikimate kinase
VVALGGGAIHQPGAREALARSGRILYLRARPQTLLTRVGDTRSRPLLRGLSPAQQLERLAALLEERRADYESASIVLDTDELSLDDVVEAAARRFEEEETT